MSSRGMEASISEDTKVKIGFAATILGVVVSCVVSISVSDARVETQIISQEKRLDVRREEHRELATQVQEINARTARIEGMLEEIKRHVR